MSANEAILVLIGGGHAAGKKSGAHILKRQLQLKFENENLKIQILDMERYMTQHQQKVGARSPQQFDFDQVRKNVEALTSSDNDVVIVYGLYALYDVELVSMATVRVFIDCDADVRLGRWIKRDVLTLTAESNEINEDPEVLKKKEKEKLEKLLNSYLNYSRSEMKAYIQDTKENADVILPKGADIAGFTLIVDGLQSLIIQKLEETHGRASSQGETPRSCSTSSLNREAVIHSIKMLSQEPSVMSLTNDNFSSKNQIFYDVN